MGDINFYQMTLKQGSISEWLNKHSVSYHFSGFIIFLLYLFFILYIVHLPVYLYVLYELHWHTEWQAKEFYSFMSESKWTHDPQTQLCAYVRLWLTSEAVPRVGLRGKKTRFYSNLNLQDPF